MTLVRLAISWHDRARANDLPASVVGGVALRTFRCHYCAFESADAETTFQHLFTHDGSPDRRVRRAA